MDLATDCIGAVGSERDDLPSADGAGDASAGLAAPE